jgi:hypothetical protein
VVKLKFTESFFFDVITLFVWLILFSQNSHQQLVSSIFLSEQMSISHQPWPNEQAVISFLFTSNTQEIGEIFLP